MTYEEVRELVDNTSFNERSDEDIRKQWAWQKIFHLIGEHTCTRDPGLLKEIRKIARICGLEVPCNLVSRP